MTLWFVIGGLILAAFVLTGVIAVRRRAAVRGRNARELGPTPRVPGASAQLPMNGSLKRCPRHPQAALRHSAGAM